MKTTILHAIKNIIDNDLYSLEHYKSLNYKIRINNSGEALENLIKDALCGEFQLIEKEKIELQSEYFSYIDRNSNMITTACENCEKDWQEKDMCYVVSCFNKNQSIRS